LAAVVDAGAVRRVIPLVSDPSVTLWHGDALDVLPLLADDSAQACITSPPYLDARPEYPSPALHEFELIFREMRRVVDGPLLLNLGRLFRARREVRWHDAMLDACERAGWELLDTKVWVKPNANPIHGEVFVNSHESIYVLGRAGDDLNIDDVRRPHADSTRARFGRGWTNHRGVKGFPDTKARTTTRGEPNPLGAHVGGEKGNPHPAPLARGVAADLVRLACLEGGWIIDPFAGSCNIGVEAVAAGRRFIGIDLHRDYLEHPRGGGRLAQGSLLLAEPAA
jgi:DNA modification methylase